MIAPGVAPLLTSKHTFGNGQAVHSACIESPSTLRKCHRGVVVADIECGSYTTSALGCGESSATECA
jgi:hypothetical protein